MVREILRKVLHIIAGTIIIAAALLIEEELFKKLLAAALGITLVLEFIHSDLKIRLPLYSGLEREGEKNRMHGSSFFMMGVTIAFLAFQKETALAATAMMVYGDGIAALTARKYAMLTMFAVSIPAGYFFVNIINALAMAATAAIVEKYFKIVDDNLAIPVLAGLIGAML